MSACVPGHLLRFALRRRGPAFCSWLLLWLLACTISWAGAQTIAEPQPRPVSFTVADENGVAVPFAQVTLTLEQDSTVLRAESDMAGRGQFPSVLPGVYLLRVQKEGFYELKVPSFRPDPANPVELVITHQQEVKETIDVVESPTAVDPAQTANDQGLSSREIVNVPYPTSRDIRNALPFIPGVVNDTNSQAHIAGGATYQNLNLLDGFNITDPVSGLLNMRLSADAIRAINVKSSRFSPTYGKASAGVLSFLTGMGDDKYRFSATNFIPSAQFRKGVNFDKWVPRVTASGPLKRGKAWFYDAADTEYILSIVKELPDGADTNPNWRVSNLSKVQVNLSPANILTGSFLYNRYHADHAGLSRFSPEETTQSQNTAAYLGTLKDQHYFGSGILLETGVGYNQFDDRERPLGSLPYEITPSGPRGSYFKFTKGQSRRLQLLANLYLPPISLAGKHSLTFGFDSDHVAFDRFITRQPFSVVRSDGTVFRRVVFAGDTHINDKDNLEIGAFGQDRWSISDRLLIEVGLRFDWDEILRRPSPAPRVAASYLLTADGKTKLSAGFGAFYDATNLELLGRPFEGPRFDTFFGADGVTRISPPVVTSFFVDQSRLYAARFLNYSVEVERNIGRSLYLTAEYLRKRGNHGPVYVNSTGAFTGIFDLRSIREDHYDAAQFTVRKTFSRDHAIFVAYTQSSARSNAVLDFSIDNPVFGLQGPGPLPWDTPHRVISWGWLPIPHFKSWDFAYSADWRSGFPFSVVNQYQQIVGDLNSHRLPDYFSLNAFVEYRFALRNHNLALRGGFDNITDHSNVAAVDNNIDSPSFLTFSTFSHRSFVGRIRFLGKK